MNNNKKKVEGKRIEKKTERKDAVFGNFLYLERVVKRKVSPLKICLQSICKE